MISFMIKYLPLKEEQETPNTHLRGPPIVELGVARGCNLTTKLVLARSVFPLQPHHQACVGKVSVSVPTRINV